MTIRSRSYRILFALNALISILCFLSACIELSDAATSVDVYRMIQYDMKGSALGSRHAGLNHFASSGMDVSDSDLGRAVIVMPLKNINLTIVNEIIEGKRFVGGLLLILPQRLTASAIDETEESEEDAVEAKEDDRKAKILKENEKISKENEEIIKDGEEISREKENKKGNKVIVGKENDDVDYKTIHDLEMLLVHSSVPVPVYFAIENEYLNSVYEKIKLNDATGNPASATNGGYKFVVNSKDAKKLPPSSIFSIEGWLYGNEENKISSELPTIAIVSSFDTFGASPSLSTGKRSGVSSVFEMMRLFSYVYSNKKSKPSHNILFSLVSGSSYNYDGTKKWLESFDQRVLENIEFSLCVDDIDDENDVIYFHVSKPPKNSSVAQFINGFANLAKHFGVDVQIIHKKINVSDPRVPWQHEQFSLKRIKAFSISERNRFSNLFEYDGGISEKRISTAKSRLARNTKLIAESLAKYVYGLVEKNVVVFAKNSSLGLNVHYVESWEKLLAKHTRFLPLLTKNSPIISAFHKEFASRLSNVELKVFSLDSTFTFYNSFQNEMFIYEVASVGFDILVLFCILLYLAFIYLLLHISTKGLDDLLGVSRRQAYKKTKTM